LTHTLVTHLLIEPRPSYPLRFIPTLVKATRGLRLTPQPEFGSKAGIIGDFHKKIFDTAVNFSELWALGSIGASGK
jgi:hypothetical protein